MRFFCCKVAVDFCPIKFIPYFPRLIVPPKEPIYQEFSRKSCSFIGPKRQLTGQKRRCKINELATNGTKMTKPRNCQVCQVRVPVSASLSTLDETIEYIIEKKIAALRVQLRQSACNNGRLTVPKELKQDVWNRLNKKP